MNAAPSDVITNVTYVRDLERDDVARGLYCCVVFADVPRLGRRAYLDSVMISSAMLNDSEFSVEDFAAGLLARWVQRQPEWRAVE